LNSVAKIPTTNNILKASTNPVRPLETLLQLLKNISSKKFEKKM
jgi:hypothetical protein